MKEAMARAQPNGKLCIPKALGFFLWPMSHHREGGDQTGRRRGWLLKDCCTYRNREGIKGSGSKILENLLSLKLASKRASYLP